MIKEQGAEFWDSNPCGGMWKSYREFMEWVQLTEPYIFRILDQYNWNGKRVIEIGCGQGATLNYLARYGAKIYGLDMSAQSIRRARSGLSELGYLPCTALVQADAEQLPFPDATFDMALSIGVLHHTVDTAAGVREIYRLLKTRGVAVVMLYRSGNPKWWITRLFRGMAHTLDLFTGKQHALANRIRARNQPGTGEGTALIELFGVPIMKAFSNRQACAMFADFAEVRISNHQPGFRRLADILPALRTVESGLASVDRHMCTSWGFYQVIEARK